MIREHEPIPLGGIGDHKRGVGMRMPDWGFNRPNNQRQHVARNFHRTDVGRNILASISEELECLTWDAPHSFRENIVAGTLLVVFLSNQSFPPILPAKSGMCVVIVRVEDGTLSEIISVFSDLFDNIISPFE
jgi:hypothetical protein